MRCAMCGAPIGNRIIKVNGVLLCENCARDYVRDSGLKETTSMLSQAFPMLDDLTSAFMSQMPDLDFANQRITCPKCQMTLREIETTGRAGCIECYNTFNETILKHVLKRQGNSNYIGRKPGEQVDYMPDKSVSELLDEALDRRKKNNDTEEKADTAEPVEETPTAKVEEVKAKKEETPVVCKITVDDDLTVVADGDLDSAMKDAIAVEDYALAAKIRDEIKRRKGEQ